MHRLKAHPSSSLFAVTYSFPSHPYTTTTTTVPIPILGSGKQQWLKVTTATDGRHSRRIITTAIKCPFPLRQLLEHGRVLLVEEGHVDVVAPDCCQGQEQNVAVDRMTFVGHRVSSTATILGHFMPLVGQPLDWSRHITAAQGRDHLLNHTARQGVSKNN